MRGFERVGDLPAIDSASAAARPRAQPLRERLALDELHHERRVVPSGRSLRVRGWRDVRMVERGEHARFALEAHEAIGIARRTRPAEA